MHTLKIILLISVRWFRIVHLILEESILYL